MTLSHGGSVGSWSGGKGDRTLYCSWGLGSVKGHWISWVMGVQGFCGNSDRKLAAWVFEKLGVVGVRAQSPG